MEFTHENQGTNSYLVYEIKADDQIDSMSLGMLTNNKINGFLTTFFTQMDARKFIKYNVSSKVSVRQFFTGTVNKKRLLGVFEGIVDGLLSAEDYMIDPASVILDLDYIFADVSTCEASLICLPIAGIPATDLSAFFKDIMFSTQFDQTENCEHIIKIINFLNSSPMVSLTDFKELLQSLKSGAQPAQTATVKPAPAAQPQVQPQAQPQVQPQAQPQVTKPDPAPSAKTPEQNFGSPVNIPPVNQPRATAAPQPQAQPAAQPAPQNGQKKMSMLDLLMHYSKENVELYKAQRASEKGAPQPAAKSAPAQSAKPGMMPSFAIPGQAAPAPASASQPQAQPTAQPAAKKMEAPAQQPAYVPRQAPQGQAANFGETTVLGGGTSGETTVLTVANNPTQAINPHIIRKKNNERVSLNKPVFRVGKERSYVDYFIGDNTAISRSHADFITRNGEYFVVDVNSKNHTYVNGDIIPSGVETPISHGDTIRLANEDFEFRLY